jgi:uncharacterized protein (TIGR03032 family)
MTYPANPPPVGLFTVDAFNAEPSAGFARWLAGHDVSLAFTTGTRLMLAGLAPGGVLSVYGRSFDTAAGLAAVGSRTLFLASRWQLWRLQNALAGVTPDGDVVHDAHFLGQAITTTGFVGAFDVAVDGAGEPMFTNAMFNCVSRLSERLSFSVAWTPPFVSSIEGGERCRVSGLVLEDDELAYVTCGAVTDEVAGWTTQLESGGVVVDCRNGELLARGLSLPHSPRLHDGRLYVTSAGTGELVEIDRSTGAARTVARVPGLARGLAFVGGHAVVGCSRNSADGVYRKLALWTGRSDELIHGLAVVDLDTGRVDHTLAIRAESGDVFAVAALHGTAHPTAAERMGAAREEFAVGPVGTLAHSRDSVGSP